MTQIIIGVDPSLTGTAVCAISLSTPEKIIYTATFMQPELKGIKRLVFLRKKLYAALKKLEQRGKIHVFIEGYAFGAKGRGVFNLAELGGVLRTMIAERFSGYWEIPPTSLKKFVTGKGNSNKTIMLERVFRKYGVGSEVLTDDNQVDAYALARFGEAILNEEKKLTEYELAAKKKIDYVTLTPVTKSDQ
jgi:crossover junction endodeoxyribonuclease RuvC